LLEGERVEAGPDPEEPEEPEPEVGDTRSTTFCTEGSVTVPPLLGDLDPEGELEPEEPDEPEGSLILGTVTLGVLTGEGWTLGVLTVGVETVGVLTVVLGT
jgi:hypothetical protein